MSILLAIIAALIVSAVLYASRRRESHTSVPLPMDRLASWELRLGMHRAEQRIRDARVNQLIDVRSVVQPKIKPKLPKENNHVT